MNVLLASCFYMQNYGSQLQAVASEFIIHKYSDEIKVINCSNPKCFMDSSRFEYYMKRITSKYSIQNQISNALGKIRSTFDTQYKNNMKIRYTAFDRYINCYHNLTEPINDRQEFYELTQNYDMVVVGSDMLWNPINVDQNYYTLEHSCEEIKKVSFATSIGTSVIDNQYVEKYKHFLSRFNCISVREESAVTLINSILGEDKAQLILDPTLQLTKMEWDMIIENSINDKKNKNEQYVFAYFLGKNVEHRKIVKQFAVEKGLRIVSIEHVDGFTKADVGFGDEPIYDCDPNQFVNMIKNAKYIFTDSFHCCAFSIIYEKIFFVFDRFNKFDKIRNNTRIDNLLNITGLQKRRIKCANDVITDIDYTDTRYKMEKMRKISAEFVKRCFE